MSPPPIATHRHVAAALLIDTEGRLLLQLRDDIPGIVHPGKVSLFGGQREEGETFLQCVTREIFEELSCVIPSERFQYLTIYQVDDPNSDTGALYAELFFAQDVPVDEIKVTEGSLFIADATMIEAIPNLTEAATVAIEHWRRARPAKT